MRSTGRRMSQSPHIRACTWLKASSPNIRVISDCIRVSSSNSPHAIFRWLGGISLWSFLTDTFHPRKVTCVLLTKSWWKSLLGDGACPVLSKMMCEWDIFRLSSFATYNAPAYLLNVHKSISSKSCSHKSQTILSHISTRLLVMTDDSRGISSWGMGTKLILMRRTA